MSAPLCTNCHCNQRRPDHQGWHVDPELCAECDEAAAGIGALLDEAPKNVFALRPASPAVRE